MFPNFATERENHKAAVTCSALETSEVAVGPGPARKFPSQGSPPKVSPVPIYDFHLFGLSVLGCGEYSTTADREHGGEFYAVSLDFNYTQLQQILSKADSRTATFVRRIYPRTPYPPGQSN